MLEKISTVKIREALARGYCHKETEKEILNPDLINAMIDEIEQLDS